MKKIFVTLALIANTALLTTAHAGDKDDDPWCMIGTWTITNTKYQKNLTMANITKVKKSNQQRAAAAKYLKGGTITFIDDKTVEFIPLNDTTVYKGKISVVEYSGWQSGGPGGSTTYGSKGSELAIKFPGKGAKFNFNMTYECPKKKTPNEARGVSYDSYAKFYFTRE